MRNSYIANLLKYFPKSKVYGDRSIPCIFQAQTLCKFTFLETMPQPNTANNKTYFLSSSKLALFAKEYTSHLLGYYEYISNNDASAQEEKTYAKDLLRFWQLAEILCFSGNSDDVIVLQLCAWLNTYWVEGKSGHCIRQRGM